MLFFCMKKCVELLIMNYCKFEVFLVFLLLRFKHTINIILVYVLNLNVAKSVLKKKCINRYSSLSAHFLKIYLTI